MPARSTPPDDTTPVAELWNLSAITASWLDAEGILTFADLRETDILELWTKLHVRHRQVTRLMYYALWGAVNNCHWNEIPEQEKKLVQSRITELRG